jgi:hypothetical protein
MKQKPFLTILTAVLMCLSIAQGSLAADGEPANLGGDSPEAEAALTEVLQRIDADRWAVVAELVDRLASDPVAAEQLEATLTGANAADLAEVVETADSLEAISAMLAGPEDMLRVGDLSVDYTYTPVTPCRIVDTRRGGGGVFSPGQSREYYVYGSVAVQGGSVLCSSLKGEPRGVHLNVTAVPVAGPGNFKAYPANVSAPNASFVNYKAGVQNVANAGTIKTYYSIGQPEIEVRNSFGTAHLVIDVMGYYHNTEHLAGADFAGGDQSIELSSDDQVVRSVSVSAPAAGRVIVNASGVFNLASDAVDVGRCSITTGAAVDLDYLIIARERLADSMRFVPFAGTRGFVVSAGTRTFRLVCDELQGTVSIHDANLTAIWVPRAY